MERLRIKHRGVSILIALVVAMHVSALAFGKAPNFVVIVADDMGWSDLGVLGGEIRTPTLDRLAAQGVTMSRFYAGPTCSPTRAMLLTGVDSHLAGLGTMAGVQAPNQVGSENYAGQLNDHVITIAEVLRERGYATLMSGKWHLGKTPSQRPAKRGFERSFSLLEGGASHFSDATPLYKGIAATYLEDDKPVDLPEDFYSSIHYTDKLLEYLDAVGPDTPIFAYLAYTAPHDPLHVPDEWLDRYRGHFNEGPEAMRAKRVSRLQERGLIPEGIETWAAPKFPAFLPMHNKPWSDLSTEEREARTKPMEVYAAMIELMDDQIGRVIRALDDSGRLADTYVIFLSDNGANGATPLSYPNSTRDWFRSTFDHSLAQQGRKHSHSYQGREWAWVSSAPFKLYKGAVAEGGIRVPFIVAGPGVAAGRMSSQTAHVTDLTASIYRIAGVEPSTIELFAGKHLPEGNSLLAHWLNPDQNRERIFATELFGHSAVVSSRWKAMKLKPPVGNGNWVLYDLESDPGEMTDIAGVLPDKLDELVAYHSRYVERVGVIEPDPPVKISVGDLFTSECNWFCQGTVSVLDTFIGLWQKLSADE